ncbi:hypothetical protein PRIPAC_95555 [Pristionchus pacificus]|uniref:Uncharacterized protein n=1 Tax=Pristionchus pacificus TaxID=54126 RepID=A0A2A6BC78_PRIPA|nr:hypothetical protein PRIPAC_95555 [Pristionchus pacificus]|eukprot:PDM63485.1 hypothetical protein PRIPAC_53842 [Pristionchus pacificus]
MNDIAKLYAITEKDKPKFSKKLFTSIIESRCAENEHCYRKEFTYFYNLFIRFPGKVKNISRYYSELLNRLFVMDDLKKRGIFEEIENMNEDFSSLKALIIERFRNYYLARQRFTGVEVLDILFAFEEADRVLEELTDPEELLLFTRVTSKYDENAFYFYELNRVVILAPFIYPKLADGNTLNKPYNLFVTLAHEIFHSVINKTWAERSDSFKDEMECYYDHFNETCEIFGEEDTCNLFGPDSK